MRDKYYTPELEEFHVGFEYERWIPKYGWAADDYSVGKFYPYTFRDGEAAEQYVDSDMARVKYLDQEDIESFGFKVSSGTYTFENGDFQLECIGETHWDKLIINFKVENSLFYETLFLGTIKNKSELGRILKQIGYEQEL